jgi:hypothetical protein
MKKLSLLMVLCLACGLVAGGAVAQKDGTPGARIQPPREFVPTPTGPTVFCSTPNLPIPDDDPLGISDSQSIADSLTLGDLDVSINTTHTWVGDLIFTLEHQDTGTSVVFYDRPGEPASTFGCDGDDIDATIDDEAATAVEDECGAGVPSIQGSFIGGDPADPTLMSSFDGEDLAGTWVLNVSDNAGGDLGTLNEWCLVIDTPPNCDLGATAARSVRAGRSLRIDLDLVHNRPATVTVPFWIWVEDAAGNVMVSKTTSPMTLAYGDHVRKRQRIKIPAGTAPGTYTVFVNVREMRQGDADASQTFVVVE